MTFYVEANKETVLDVIKQSKDIVKLANSSTDYLNIVDALSVNVKNAIIFEKCDAKCISKKDINEFYINIVKTKNILDEIINAQLRKLADINNDKDDYDSMSKEELIKLLRNK